VKSYENEKLDDLLNVDPEHPHIHIVDMPYRITSTWQDHACEPGIWGKEGQAVARAIFQPAWWNLDYAGQIEPLGIHPDHQGMGLGKALEISAYQILKNRRASLIKVDHASFNDKAIALSLKTGFRQKNKALRFFIDINNNDDLDAR